MQRLLFHGLLLAVPLHTNIAEYGLQGAQAWELWHVDLAWDLPGPGIKPVSPALAGRFLKTGPARKSYITLLKIVPCSLPSCLHRTKAATDMRMAAIMKQNRKQQVLMGTWRNWSSCVLLTGTQKSTATVGNSTEASQTLKNGITTQPSNSSQKNGKQGLEEIFVHTCSQQYYSQWLTHGSNPSVWNCQNVLHPHNGMLFSL